MFNASKGYLSLAAVCILFMCLTPPKGYLNPSWDPERFYKMMRRAYFPKSGLDKLATMTHCALWVMREGFTPEEALLLCIKARNYVPTDKDERCKNPQTMPPFGYDGDQASYDSLSDKERRKVWRPARIAMGQFDIGVLPVWRYPFRPVEEK